MNAIERKTYLMHSETDEYQFNISESGKNVKEGLAICKKPYIAFSGGKDSLVMMHLVLQKNPDILVWHWDYGPYFMPRSVLDEISQIAAGIGARNFRVDQTGYKAYEQAKRSGKPVFYRYFFGVALPALKKEGYDGAFIGLRADESRKRGVRTKSIFEKTPGMISIFPIRHLTVRDVWAYIVSNDLPYCNHYDRYAELEGRENVRFCTYFDPEFAHMGRTNVDGVLQPEFRNQQ